MEEEIGKTAGAIWQALSTQGGLSLTRLKNQVKARAPVFDWAIGWLAREDQIVIPAEKPLSESARKGDGRFTRFDCFPWGKQG
jgi:hypothetical protein